MRPPSPSADPLEEILDAVGDVVWSSGPDRSIRYVSRAFEDVYGVPRSALVEDPTLWRRLIHPDDRARVERELLHLRSGAPVTVEFRVVRPDGAVRHVHYRARAILDAAGALERFAGVTRDVTEARGLEEQVRRTQRLDALGRLTGGIAHEFNNLLTALLGHATLLEPLVADAPEAMSHVRQVHQAVERAAALTRQMLAFGRRGSFAASAVDLGPAVASTLELIRPTLGPRIRVEAREEPDLPPVEAGPDGIAQIVMNLALNARDAMPAGGILTVVMRRAPEDGTSVELVVSDTGSGMSDEVRAHLFEPFFTTKGPGKGTGLGLATVYGIVRQFRGAIEVDSAPGRGSTFRVRLPVAAADGLEPAGTAVPLSTGRVLVVDDDEAVRDLTADVLRGAGWHVELAGDGEAAVVALESASVPFDLVVTDLTMPRLGGRGLAAAMRARLTATRWLVISGFVSPEATASPELRDLPFLAKPFTPGELLEAVRRAVQT